MKAIFKGVFGVGMVPSGEEDMGRMEKNGHDDITLHFLLAFSFCPCTA